MSQRVLASLVFAATIAFALGPFFTSFDGFDPNAYPIPQDQPPVQPAGYAFSIWGVIYLWLIGSTGYGLFKRTDDAVWAATRKPLLVSLAIGVIWLPVAEQSPIWATILIWIMLLTALKALLRTTADDRWLLQAPIGLYAGWLTAASSVSIGLTGAGYGLLFDERIWAVIAIAVALAIASYVIKRGLHTATYAFALVWALAAIILQNMPDEVLIAGIAAAGAVVIAFLNVALRDQTL